MTMNDVDWRIVLKWSLRLLLALAALALLVAGYVAYRTVLGKPLRFNDLLVRQAVEQVLDSPETMTIVGVVDGAWYDFSSDKLDRYSLENRHDKFDRVRRFDDEIAAWDRSKLAPQEQLSYDILRWGNARQLADEKYPWLAANSKPYPVEPAFGIQKSVVEFLLSMHQIKNARLARHYVARLKAIGPVIDAVREDVKRQAGLGVIAPDFIIDHSVDQMRTLIAPAPQDNPLVTHLVERAQAIGLDGEEVYRLEEEAAAIVATVIYPAYQRLIAEELRLRKSANHDAGIWRIKGGSDYYADQLRLLTSTDMTPDQIHQYGLSEVARINAELNTLLQSVGLSEGTVGERIIQMMADPRFHYPNTAAGREAQLSRYRQILGRVQLLLPKYFAHIPRFALNVERVPAFAEKGSAGAYYEPPSLDGSRPGTFFANLRDTTETPMWAMPTLAYHEGIPGHHMQIATATEITNLPYQRRLAFFPAFGEGWALYAEYLANDMGLYAGDPYGDIGRLQSELFRAVRLVVDTGMHAKHWSREQAIEYMRKTTGSSDAEVTAEIERYVVWPGQACAYKIGMKSILDLRQKAQSELGRGFDLRAFHSIVLENGAEPLWLLRRTMEAWIAERRVIRH